MLGILLEFLGFGKIFFIQLLFFFCFRYPLILQNLKNRQIANIQHTNITTLN